jgi:hypothetical protein
MRLLREPLVHFGVLGALLFVLWSVVRRGEPAGRPGPARADHTVTVRREDVESLRAGFRAAWKREPTPGELGDLLLTFVNEEVLYREGMAQGLDRDDRLVRGRVIEKMTALARPTAPGEPTADELRRWYQTYAHRFRRPATVTLQQLFFDPRQRGDADAAARQALATLATQGDAPLPSGVGDRSVLPALMTDRSAIELAHLLSPAFSAAALDAPPGRWQGPVASRYGVHLIRVVSRGPERLPPFEEIEKHVRADWLTVENRGLRAAAESLLPRYEVVLPPGLQPPLPELPALAPLLRRAR